MEKICKRYTGKELKITRDICDEIYAFNIDFQKRNPDADNYGRSWIDDFSWKPFEHMDNRNKSVHLQRVRELLSNGVERDDASEIHNYFVQQRIMRGWILEDKKQDFDKSGAWLGHDPFLIPLSDCPPGFIDFCNYRNDIFYRHCDRFIK